MWMTDDGVSEAMVLALRAHWKRERRAKAYLYLVSDVPTKVTAWEEKTKGGGGVRSVTY